MSTLVSQMMGAGTPPESTAPVAAPPANTAEPQFINGVWMVPLGAAPSAPAQGAVDPRIIAASASPVFQALPQIQGAVLAALAAAPTLTADQAIAQVTRSMAPAGPAAPPAPPAPAAHVPQPFAAAPAPAQLPAPPPGYAYATMPNGTLGFVAVAQAGHAAAIHGRVDATGVNNVPAAQGGASPTGVPVAPGLPAPAAQNDGYLPGDVKGSITLAAAPWDKHIKAANARVAGFTEPKVHAYIEHDPQA